MCVPFVSNSLRKTFAIRKDWNNITMRKNIKKKKKLNKNLKNKIKFLSFMNDLAKVHIIIYSFEK